MASKVFSGTKEELVEAIGSGKSFDGYSFFTMDFSQANLRRADFNNCLFTNCKFVGADLEDAKFNGSVMKQCDFRDARLLDVIANDADFSHCSFINADLRGVSFHKTDLTGCSFQGSRIHSVDFTHTDLYGAKGIRLVSCMGEYGRDIVAIAHKQTKDNRQGLMIQAGCFFDTAAQLKIDIEGKYQFDDSYLGKDYQTVVKMLVAWRKGLTELGF